MTGRYLALCLPGATHATLIAGLTGFVEGRVVRAESGFAECHVAIFYDGFLTAYAISARAPPVHLI